MLVLPTGNSGASYSSTVIDPTSAMAGPMEPLVPLKTPTESRETVVPLTRIPNSVKFVMVPLNRVSECTVELVWFPTGGGKTEAYLGLAAIEIFRRRLEHGEA